MIRRLVPTALLCAVPVSAGASPLTTSGVFLDAHPLMKLVMAGLLAATVAAVVVCVLKLASGRLSGGSAFLAGLRVGGPLAGLLGAAYVALRMLIGLSNLESAPPLRIVAPGLAEAVLLIGLGLLAGAVATVCHWLVEARIDRAALRA